VNRTGASGRDLSELTLEAIREGSVEMADLSVHPVTLEHQAEVAAQHDNPQLAANFRRAAELTSFGDAEVLELYEALRPHRSTLQQLLHIASDLEGRGASLNALLFREAAEVYERRRLLKP
jgi:propanediol dehydratase small subunit